MKKEKINKILNNKKNLKILKINISEKFPFIFFF